MVNYTLMSVFLLSFYFIGLGSAETEFEKIYTECVDDMKKENLMYFNPDCNTNLNVANLTNLINTANNRIVMNRLSSGYAYIFIKNHSAKNLKPRFKNPYSFCLALKSYRQPYILVISEITLLPRATLRNIREECLCDMVSHGLATHVNTECVGNMDSHGLATDDDESDHWGSYSDANNLNAVIQQLNSNVQSLNKSYAYTFISSYYGNTLKDDCKVPTTFCQALSEQVDPFTNTDFI
ncbi:uncharacterized protein LOC132926275 [Rhopalosiphum padi]|uniref:uncharacterized protein LOC132926275 n=1 Tax=Rhopalosiphum padi TaxID=40932 RepID=UPI00298D83F0|nr:uncharacterized protein LOC132926275 [Rhopalosiphum padi]